MKFEYRYLSEKRAAEIDAMGIITPNGQKSVLIDILCELSRHRAKKIIEGTVEIIYKGKRVK